MVLLFGSFFDGSFSDGSFAFFEASPTFFPLAVLSYHYICQNLIYLIRDPNHRQHSQKKLSCVQKPENWANQPSRSKKHCTHCECCPMLHILARQDSMILHFNMVWLSWWVPSFSIGLFPKPKTGREFATFCCYQTLIIKSTISIHYHHCHFLVEFQLPLFFSLLLCPPASSFLSSCQVLILSLSIWLLAIFKFNCFQLRAITKDKKLMSKKPVHPIQNFPLRTVALDNIQIWILTCQI